MTRSDGIFCNPTRFSRGLLKDTLLLRILYRGATRVSRGWREKRGGRSGGGGYPKRGAGVTGTQNARGARGGREGGGREKRGALEKKISPRGIKKGAARETRGAEKKKRGAREEGGSNTPFKKA